MKLTKILIALAVLLSFGFTCKQTQAKEKTALEIFNPLVASTQFNVDISDGTLVWYKTFASATDVDTSSSSRSQGVWWNIAEYPRLAVSIAVNDTQKVKVLTDYRAGLDDAYQTYDPAGDTVSTLATTLTRKVGTVVLRAYGTDNIPGANWVRFRMQSITGSEYDDPAYFYLYRGL